MLPSDLPTLTLAVQRARLVSYFNGKSMINLRHPFLSVFLIGLVSVASLVILIYDWFFTIRLEVATIWKSQWSVMKVLYITTRYVAYLQFVDLVYYNPRPNGAEPLTSVPKVCQIAYEIHVWSLTIGVGAGEALLSLRTWAVWGGSRKMALGLGILWAIAWGTALVLVVTILRAVQYGVTPQASNVVCYAIPSSSTTILISPWVIYLLWNTMMLVLMAIPAYKTFQLSGSHTLSKVVYQDGLIYYSYLFVLSLVNIIVIMTTHVWALNAVNSLLTSQSCDEN
ncbi:unnamed protein product [Cyclocybe aegerita]|uniref:DUF6533 domain-containing protein n=1 Tax=Cyclocybe aegerita TaxID=1973307 RepID=A0A8S0W2E5_CYCAE|nr:unnamed protein product [Cyclocybe aegerita]